MRSVVKHSYIKASPAAKGTARAHLHYIQHRSGHDKEVGGRQFFDRDADESDGKWFRQELSKAPEYGAVMHKFILSPGCKGVDLREYTREVMESLGDSKGLELNWQGIIHTNTEHDHVHVVVLGRDKNGKAVKFTRQDHDVCRGIGDRYLERKHEFDRYFDKSVEKIFREESRSLDLDRLDRSLDLDKLFQPYRNEPSKESGRKGKRSEKEHQTHELRTALPARRKSRKQRLMEARGRNDFYHDLYVSNMNKQRLQNLREVRPERAEEIDRELAGQQKHDELRRADIARQVAQLDKILGLTPKKQRDRSEDRELEYPEASEMQQAQPTGAEEKARADRLLDEFIEKKGQLEQNKDQEAIRVLELEYARKVFKSAAVPAAKQDVKTENENKESDKKEIEPEKPKEIEPSFEPLPDLSQIEISIDEPAKPSELSEPGAIERQEEEIADAEKKLGEFELLLKQFQELVEQRSLEIEKQQKEKEREEKEREEEEKEKEHEEEER